MFDCLITFDDGSNIVDCINDRFVSIVSILLNLP